MTKPQLKPPCEGLSPQYRAHRQSQWPLSTRQRVDEFLLYSSSSDLCRIKAEDYCLDVLLLIVVSSLSFKPAFSLFLFHRSKKAMVKKHVGKTPTTPSLDFSEQHVLFQRLASNKQRESGNESCCVAPWSPGSCWSSAVLNPAAPSKCTSHTSSICCSALCHSPWSGFIITVF